jgi:hypothetical protein
VDLLWTAGQVIECESIVVQYARKSDRVTGNSTRDGIPWTPFIVACKVKSTHHSILYAMEVSIVQIGISHDSL